MTRSRLAPPLAAALLLAPLALGQPPAPDKALAPAAGFVRFRVQEIDTKLKVGYAVVLADVNGDRKDDIVVVDTNRVIWYENPTWQPRLIAQGEIKPQSDNVCIAAADIDGDGQVDLALGAGWGRFDTKDDAPIVWLKRGAALDDLWTQHRIGGEPSVHRMRFADTDGDGKPELIVAPLLGRDSTRAANWMDGRPVRLLAYPIPADPVKGPWPPRVLDETLHVVHNFAPIPAEGRKGVDLLAASYEGVTLLTPGMGGGPWSPKRLGEGNQNTPNSNRGSSEIKQGRLKGGTYIATIEPWHGNQVVLYLPREPGSKLLRRQVLDEQLRWGHAVWCADLDGDGDEELIIGVRDDPGRGDQFKERRGVRIYKARDDTGQKWDRQLVDAGGVAVEDLAAGDLNGDGRIDLVAVGRQTGNVRIYWNEK